MLMPLYIISQSCQLFFCISLRSHSPSGGNLISYAGEQQLLTAKRMSISARQRCVALQPGEKCATSLAAPGTGRYSASLPHISLSRPSGPRVPVCFSTFRGCMSSSATRLALILHALNIQIILLLPAFVFLSHRPGRLTPFHSRPEEVR